MQFFYKEDDLQIWAHDFEVKGLPYTLKYLLALYSQFYEDNVDDLASGSSLEIQ